MTRPNILIADDDQDLVDVLSLRCQARNINVTTAKDAMTALAKIDTGRPDLVILDVNMPEGNGLSVCEMMASHAELCTIPVIILTGNCSPDTVRRCIGNNAYYVAKSTDIWSRLEPLLQTLLCLDPAATRPPRVEALTAELALKSSIAVPR